jgi:hypothetical protein
MKMAAATTGFERLEWVRVAQAWLDLEAERARLATTQTRKDQIWPPISRRTPRFAATPSPDSPFSR